AAPRAKQASAPPKPAATPKPATAPKPAAAAQPKPAAAEGRAETAPQRASRPAPAKELPVSGYDEASLASVRARLRGLDARQVGELRDYERSHAARADFLRMYENRITKLRTGE
ncbi:MAG: hypothetical protein JWR24_4177, partial [Actinoallomurus sp.]|nr:hypothetical protein [Actinoallomurus sp.]